MISWPEGQRREQAGMKEGRKEQPSNLGRYDNSPTAAEQAIRGRVLAEGSPWETTASSAVPGRLKK